MLAHNQIKVNSNLFDTHAHLNFSAFKDDADEVIKKSLKGGVFMINAGSQYSTSQRAVKYADAYAGVYAAVGLHPIHIQDEEFDYVKYLELARNPKVVAIGEMGLDYFHLPEGVDVAENKRKQEEVFLAGIKLANETGKPMIVHCRKAYDELLEILQSNPVKKKGVIHCFVGSLKTAQKFIELGYRIGLNGIITYSPSYDKLIKNIALKDILLETDCPYLNPKPLPREGRNEPVNVSLIAAKIAEIKEVDAGEVEEMTTRGAAKTFDVII